MSSSEINLSGMQSYSHLLRQRDICSITLFVVSVLIIITAISVGIAGLMNSISLERATSISILISGSIIGSSLIISSIYINTICNFLNGLPSTSSNNNRSMSTVRGIRAGIKYSQSYKMDCHGAIIKSGWREQSVAKFKMTTENVDVVCDLINNEIEKCTKQSIPIFISAEGSINRGVGEINVHLLTLVKEQNNCIDFFCC